MIKWTEEDIDYLKNNYNLPYNDLILNLGHPINSIKDKMWKLGLSREYYWSKEDTDFLINNYDKLMAKDIAKKIDKTVKSVKKKASTLKLKKPEDFKYNKDINNKIFRSEYWNDEDIEYLMDNFFDISTDEISKKLNRTKISIQIKANKLGLKKNPKFKSDATIKKNKDIGRDLTYDFLKNSASKYKTRGEFQIKDGSAYTTARKSGILDDICSHMLICNYSIPQLILNQIIKNLIDPECSYNNRKIVYPYEIDVYSSKYKLGFEYNGKGWHGEEKESFKRDIIKKKMCLNENITLIIIIENNRYYEKDIKNQLIENIDIINNITKLNITIDSILNCDVNYEDLLMDKDDVKKICLSYDNYTLFKKEQKSIYNTICRNKLLLDYTKHMKRKINLWDEISLKDEISKYEYLGDFIKKSKGAYSYCKRHDLEYLYSHLKRLKKKLNEKSIINFTDFLII